MHLGKFSKQKVFLLLTHLTLQMQLECILCPVANSKLPCSDFWRHYSLTRTEVVISCWLIFTSFKFNKKLLLIEIHGHLSHRGVPISKLLGHPIPLKLYAIAILIFLPNLSECKSLSFSHSAITQHTTFPNYLLGQHRRHQARNTSTSGEQTHKISCKLPTQKILRRLKFKYSAIFNTLIYFSVYLSSLLSYNL